MDWLAELAPELQLLILEAVDDFSDCAAVSLATPRLGLLAFGHDLARFKDPLFAVAMQQQLAQRAARGDGHRTRSKGEQQSPVTEAILRKYSADRRARQEHFPWLERVSPALCLSTGIRGLGSRRFEFWRLQRGDEPGALLRERSLQRGTIWHFTGEAGAERQVRTEYATGEVQLFEGEKGAERLVRTDFLDGTIKHHEGARGSERVVRTAYADGRLKHFEGEMGAERKVRTQFPDGGTQYYEGERGVERRVRTQFPTGNVQYYEGAQNLERLVRLRFPSGEVQFYEGELGAERCVRREVAGRVYFYEGEKGAEAVVRVVQATTETRLKAMRVTELREECGRLGLVTTGVKADLVARLRAYRSAPVPQCIPR